MNPIFCVLALAVVAVSGQQVRPRQGRQQADTKYGAPALPAYNEPQADSSNLAEATEDHQGTDWLLKSVPGTPGTDYPILAEVPETKFACDGQVEGGYYADPDTECQAFHVCTADGNGGLSKNSFLCPNGTIFNQNYFICDWWFNFDCSEASGLYSLNEKVAAERDAASVPQTAASSNQNSYAAPPAAPAQPDYARQARRFNN